MFSPGAVTPGTLAVESAVEMDRREASADARYFRRLARQLRDQFVEHGTSGIVLRDTFAKLDRSLTNDNFEVDRWAFKAMLRGPTALGDKDLDTLFGEMQALQAAQYGAPSDVVDLAEVLVYFRRMFGHLTAQFHAILKRLRAKKLDFGMSPFNVTAAPTRLAVYEYLCKSGTTQSEAFVVLERACSTKTPSPARGDGDLAKQLEGELDVDYLVNALYAFPLPDDIAYPLLLGKLVDTAADSSRELTGTLGLRRALGMAIRGVTTSDDLPVAPAGGAAQPQPVQPDPLPKQRHVHGRFARDTASAAAKPQDATPAAGVNAAPAADPEVHLDASLFRAVCGVFGGVSASEADVLFSFVCDPDGTLHSSALLQLVASRLPLASQTDYMSIVADTRALVVAHDFAGLCALHEELAAYGDEAVPLPVYAAALRRCGVPTHFVADIDVEHLHREAPTCVALVLLLRGTLPAPREAVLKKLFARLDGNDDGLIDRRLALACFVPEAANPKIVNRAAERKDGFARYIASLPSDDASMTYAEFSYYWGNVSASISDDPGFVMMIWQSYGMQRDGQELTPLHVASVSVPRQRAADGNTPPPHVQRAADAAASPARRGAHVPLVSAVPMGDEPAPRSRRRVIH